MKSKWIEFEPVTISMIESYVLRACRVCLLCPRLTTEKPPPRNGKMVLSKCFTNIRDSNTDVLNQPRHVFRALAFWINHAAVFEHGCIESTTSCALNTGVLNRPHHALEVRTYWIDNVVHLELGREQQVATISQNKTSHRAPWLVRRKWVGTSTLCLYWQASRDARSMRRWKDVRKVRRKLPCPLQRDNGSWYSYYRSDVPMVQWLVSCSL